jgi:hypothetical protein
MIEKRFIAAAAVRGCAPRVQRKHERSPRVLMLWSEPLRARRFFAAAQECSRTLRMSCRFFPHARVVRYSYVRRCFNMLKHGL